MDAGSLARLDSVFRPDVVPDDANGLLTDPRDVCGSDGTAPGVDMPAIRRSPADGELFVWEAAAAGAEIGSTFRLRPANGSVFALAWLLPPRENGKYFAAPVGPSCDIDLLAARSRSARFSSLRSEAVVGPV